MKGLLLKDLYMTRAYCKSYLLILVVFLAASFIVGNTAFVYYPCLLCGMIPVSLLAYDERSRFLQYGAALPVSRAQLVAEKYLVGLISQTAVLLLSGIAVGIRAGIAGTFEPAVFAVTVLSLLVTSVLAFSIPLPFIFKYGVEKGRIAYYVMVGFVCAAGVIFWKGVNLDWQTGISPALLISLLAAVGIGLFALSWYLSTVFYKKREL